MDIHRTYFNDTLYFNLGIIILILKVFLELKVEIGSLKVAVEFFNSQQRNISVIFFKKMLLNMIREITLI